MEWLNYHHLHYFWMVAKEGGISRAAKQLHLAQPTLSSQIKKLEQRLKSYFCSLRSMGLERGESLKKKDSRLFLLPLLPLPAVADTLILDSRPAAAILYPNSGTVTHVAILNATSGQHEIVFPSLPAGIGLSVSEGASAGFPPSSATLSSIRPRRLSSQVRRRFP